MQTKYVVWWVHLISLCLNTVSGQELVVVEGPRDIAVLSGENTELTCHIDDKASKAGHAVQWIGNSARIGSGAYISINRVTHIYKHKFSISTQKPYNLKLQNVSINDAGSYRCINVRTGKMIGDRNVHLVVFEPALCPLSMVKTARENETLSLVWYIRYAGNRDDLQKPTITWTLDGVIQTATIDESTHGVFRSTLTINVSSAHNQKEITSTLNVLDLVWGCSATLNILPAITISATTSTTDGLPYSTTVAGGSTSSAVSTTTAGVSTPSSVVPLKTMDQEKHSSDTVGIILGAVVGSLVAIISLSALALWVFKLRRKVRRLKQTSRNNNDTIAMSELLTEGSEDTEDLQMPLKEYQPQDIAMGATLGKGEFGIVKLAVVKDETCGPFKAAAKILKDNASDSDNQEFQLELGRMRQLPKHNNVVELLGYVSYHDRIMILVEYLQLGDLHTYMRTNKTEYIRGNNVDTSRELVQFGLDVARGMHHISSYKFLHRDLAARNVLLSSDKVCKISDFGLSRNVGENAVYYRVIGASSTPYPDLNSKAVLELVKSGKVMDRPQHCKLELYNVMVECWNQDAGARPCFADIASKLEDILRHESPYINTREFNEHMYMYKPENMQEKL